MGTSDPSDSRRRRTAPARNDSSLLNDVPRFWKWLALTLIVIVVILCAVFICTVIAGVIKNDPTFTQMAAGSALVATHTIF
ncbi:hypothetical protein [Brachybacterium tyrofermentans]|uniref:hypothetical protein n=1 Tax=Brachybacterium tyrofermentans TaxID=47848 RepID=UPI003FB744B9